MTTSCREPDTEPTSAVVGELLAQVGERAPRSGWTWVRTGSASIVVLAGDVAVRVARDGHPSSERAGPGSALVRSRTLVDALPDLGIAVPRSLGEPLQVGGVLAVATTRLPGTPRPTGPAPVAELRRLLEAVHSVDPAPLQHLLAEPRSFVGGVDSDLVLRRDVVPRLPSGLRAEALRRVDALAALPTVPCVLNHGDLAGGNVLWDRGRVVGVLDWDLAALDDPAEDVAALATWHGFDETAPAVADPATVRRARVFHEAFCLMPAGFAILRGREEDEVDRSLQRAAARLRRDASRADRPPRLHG